MTIYDIIRKPVITDKIELLRRNYNKFTFEVNRDANKIEIRNAVEKLFSVKVEEVATINMKAKMKRHGAKVYYTALRKKAVVKLKSGDSIKYFEGV